MSLRIIGGEARGRRISAPAGQQTRPTTDRVREALFSIVTSRLGSLAGVSILDLYAGSGALGLEGISRGADMAVFVDQCARSVTTIRRNAETLGFAGCCEVMGCKVATALRRLEEAGRGFDLVLADPPYSEGAAEVLQHLSQAPAVVQRLLIIEQGSRSERGPSSPGLTLRDTRRYGDSRLTIYERET